MSSAMNDERTREPDDEQAERSHLPPSQLVHLLDLRLRILTEREAARDEETNRLHAENSDLRRELQDVRLETAIMKQQLESHVRWAKLSDGRLWTLICMTIVAFCLLPLWLALFT